MATALILDVVTTLNTADGGHDCPVEVTFRACDFDNFDDDSKTQVKSLKIVPDEKVMPGARVYSNLPAEITEGNDLHKAMDATKATLKRAVDSGMYLIAYDFDVLMKILSATFERTVDAPQAGVIDTSSGLTIPQEKTISIKTLAKSILSPADVGMSFAAEALMMYFEDEAGFRAERRRFDDHVVTRSVYNQELDSVILRKLCQAKGLSSFEDVVKLIEETPTAHFTFGKYSGALVESVFKTDFKYCLWCFRNDDLMASNPGLKRELTRLMSRNRKAM